MTGKKHNNDAAPAVLIGLDSLQGLQAARILRDRGVPVYGIAADPDHPACRTNSCRDIRYADTGGAELVERLVELGRELGVRGVLFPCQDKSVRIVSAHRDRLAECFEIVLPPQATVDTLMDKDAFHRHALAHGLPVPETWEADSSEDPAAIADRSRFPCLVKPARRSAAWDRHTRRKVFIARDRAELLARLRECRAVCERFVLQQWIEGGDDCLYSCNLYIGRDGRRLASFVARKLRQWPVDAGSSCLGEEVRDETVLNTAIDLFAGIDYRGLGYLEMKRDASSGRYYVIEPNVGRPTGRSAIAEGGGVELLYTMYCDALGLPLPSARVQHYRGTKWLDLRHDLQSAWCYWRRGELTIAGWLRSIAGPKTHAIFSWRDPRPFLADLANAVRRVVRPATGSAAGGRPDAQRTA